MCDLLCSAPASVTAPVPFSLQARRSPCLGAATGHSYLDGKSFQVLFRRPAVAAVFWRQVDAYTFGVVAQTQWPTIALTLQTHTTS
eukprot:m.192850 g.192850  ORF g.192850 m.192850 type:complete len:86 (-) comp15173_c0_seq10:1576-1833(-)